MNDAKPFEATAGRIARARREGDMPRSSELTSALALAGACAVLSTIAQPASNAATAAFYEAAAGKANLLPYVLLAAFSLSPCIAAGAGAVLASSVVAGGFFAQPLRIDLAKLQPLPGLRRMFSKRSFGAGLRALTAACLSTAAMLPVIAGAAARSMAATTPQPVAAATLDTTWCLLTTAAVLGAAFGAIDALLERSAWLRRLRMSAAEMKQDLKQSEGDPELRNRRRGQHRALIRGSMSRLPNATFVVANPAHVAIALEYRPPQVAVPRILIRAIDEGARLVKSRARDLGIPVFEDVTLARTLFATTRIDEAIPRACYLAVARIVALLLQAERKG